MGHPFSRDHIQWVDRVYPIPQKNWTHRFFVVLSLFARLKSDTCFSSSILLTKLLFLLQGLVRLKPTPQATHGNAAPGFLLCSAMFLDVVLRPSRSKSCPHAVGRSSTYSKHRMALGEASSSYWCLMDGNGVAGMITSEYGSHHITLKRVMITSYHILLNV